MALGFPARGGVPDTDLGPRKACRVKEERKRKSDSGAPSPHIERPRAASTRMPLAQWSLRAGGWSRMQLEKISKLGRRKLSAKSEQRKVSENSSANAPRMRATNLPCHPTHDPSSINIEIEILGIAAGLFSRQVNLSPTEYLQVVRGEHASVSETTILGAWL